MKKLSNSKAWLILLMIVACFVLPMKAQNCDVFFRNDEFYENRDEGDLYFNLTNQHFGDEDNITYQLYNQHFGQTMPLGEGLLVMIGAGACYTMRKRKQTNKE